ncbi:hypothetical protein [Micromonospora eburnea]|nr:hypothetical protein [Micromonospora eburnea]
MCYEVLRRSAADNTLLIAATRIFAQDLRRHLARQRRGERWCG